METMEVYVFALGFFFIQFSNGSAIINRMREFGFAEKMHALKRGIGDTIWQQATFWRN